MKKKYIIIILLNFLSTLNILGIENFYLFQDNLSLYNIEKEIEETNYSFKNIEKIKNKFNQAFAKSRLLYKIIKKKKEVYKKSKTNSDYLEFTGSITDFYKQAKLSIKLYPESLEFKYLYIIGTFYDVDSERYEEAIKYAIELENKYDIYTKIPLVLNELFYKLGGEMLIGMNPRLIIKLGKNIVITKNIQELLIKVKERNRSMKCISAITCTITNQGNAEKQIENLIQTYKKDYGVKNYYFYKMGYVTHELYKKNIRLLELFFLKKTKEEDLKEMFNNPNKIINQRQSIKDTSKGKKLWLGIIDYFKKEAEKEILLKNKLKDSAKLESKQVEDSSKFMDKWHAENKKTDEDYSKFLIDFEKNFKNRYSLMEHFNLMEVFNKFDSRLRRRIRDGEQELKDFSLYDKFKDSHFEEISIINALYKMQVGRDMKGGYEIFESLENKDNDIRILFWRAMCLGSVLKDKNALLKLVNKMLEKTSELPEISKTDLRKMTKDFRKNKQVNPNLELYLVKKRAESWKKKLGMTDEEKEQKIADMILKSAASNISSQRNKLKNGEIKQEEYNVSLQKTLDRLKNNVKSKVIKQESYDKFIKELELSEKEI